MLKKKGIKTILLSLAMILFSIGFVGCFSNCGEESEQEDLFDYSWAWGTYRYWAYQYDVPTPPGSRYSSSSFTGRQIEDIFIRPKPDWDDFTQARYDHMKSFLDFMGEEIILTKNEIQFSGTYKETLSYTKWGQMYSGYSLNFNEEAFPYGVNRDSWGFSDVIFSGFRDNAGMVFRTFVDELTKTKFLLNYELIDNTDYT
ncbi:MAG: hypothetical protein FWH03_06815 [Firmicutes bacterium]|nr:hypothetical protein [Bacillota bacterium]